MNMRRLARKNARTFEYGIWQLIFKNITIHVIGVYRSGSVSTPAQFMPEFFDFMEDSLSKYNNILIMGDFNIHVDQFSSSISEFKDSLCAIGLIQHVNFSTHIAGHSLDLVITEAINGIQILSCEPGTLVSDHCVIKCILNVKKESMTSKTLEFRNLKQIDHSNLSSDLAEICVESDDIDTFVNTLETKLESVLEKHAPLIKKQITCRNPKPWFNSEILHLKRTLRKAERVWRKYGQSNQLDKVEELRLEYHYKIIKEKTKVLCDKVITSKGDSKKLYKLVSELTGTKSENPMPSAESDHSLAENFADFFMNKINKIRESLEDYECYVPEERDTSLLHNFQELTTDEVKKLIMELQTKSCELDKLPTHILKMHINELLQTITNLVNQSLKQGIFPSQWKQAIVRPLLKKTGLELVLSNYRPVSNLSFLSKLIEKSALLRLNEHVDRNNLLPKNQSAYRRYHSCETALLRLVSDTLNGMEHKEVSALIALDLSAAFDTVDHDILLKVLKSQYGLRGTAIEWIDSYLRPRSCRVSVDSAISDPRPLGCSVPQGSCLGPWLYLTYAGTLFSVIPKSISVYGFADDHIAKKSFKPTTVQLENQAIKELEQCATTIDTWMKQNKLKMNSSKTEFILVGSRQQLKKCNTKSIDIAGDTVESVPCIRYLGAYLDEQLTFKDHIKRKCQTAMFNYLRIKNIRKYLTKDATEILVLSLVMSHLDYCNGILYGVDKCDIKKLQRIQNMCAKLVLGLRKYDSSKHALYKLHWLPINARIQFKILTTMFNCSKDQAPVYLTELLTAKVPKRRLRSSDITGCYVEHMNKNKTFADRSFKTVGPLLWNTLPFDIRNSANVELFKKTLKTLFFGKFDSWF